MKRRLLVKPVLPKWNSKNELRVGKVLIGRVSLEFWPDDDRRPWEAELVTENYRFTSHRTKERAMAWLEGWLYR